MRFRTKNVVLAAALFAALVFFLFNPASQDGLSAKSSKSEHFGSFYAALRGLGSAPEDSEEYVISLSEDHSHLAQLLQERAARLEALPLTWQGNRSARHFRKGDTLKKVLSTEAKKEGVELFWTLSQDYKIKHYFQTSFSYLDAVKEAASAVASDFPEPVNTYFCRHSRAVILTTRAFGYLREHCINLHEPAEDVTAPDLSLQS